MMGCVFCEIVEGNKPREIVSETKNFVVILSNPSLMKGHTLVIPKRHVEKLSELKDDEKRELIEEIIKIEEKLLEKFSGCDIKQNYRPFLEESGLKVSHLHFHVQPRELNDELYKNSQIYEKDLFKEITFEELTEIKNEFFENGK